ncbi:52 kDa repressor of the inhibitor of the protein kinase-like [Hydra vulgaris]|uniref:52 kDa repressor of the inhibitor of the protein kinase-like n=1 Tax=Hydra vulgaris TaxID=6087 RepID=A0ABM4DHY3_HYDVU
MYKSNLSNSDAVDQEFMFWKRKWSVIKPEGRPNTLAKAIKICEKNQYPNLFELLKIICTLPVTSAECERSFSVMRRFRTWLKARLTADRLGSLAIMNIHYNKIVDYKQISKLFFTLHPKKLYEKV